MESIDTFYKGALQRTGTLVGDAKQGMLKRSGTMSEAAKGGLQRSGTVYQGAKETFLKRTGTITQTISESNISKGAIAGWQQAGAYVGGAKNDLARQTGSWSQWVTWGKGLYSPEVALKASFLEITGIDLPRSHHSISVINGRAYVFGGEYAPGQLADNNMHVIILPSSSVLGTDYKSIPAQSSVQDGLVPEGRKGHTAVVIENNIFIFGGALSPKAKEEEARVWIFDTISNKWSYHDPKADSPYPQTRFSHAAVASVRPGRQYSAETAIDLAEQGSTRSKVVPDLPESDTWGTMFIYGGKAVQSDGEEIDGLLNDAWVYDVATRTWLPLPPPPGPARFSASLILCDDHLYRAGGFSASDQSGSSVNFTADFLNIGELFRALSLGNSFSRIALPTLLSEWTTSELKLPIHASSVTAITPGNSGGGRKFLLAIPAAAKDVAAIDLSPPSTVRLAGADAPENDKHSFPVYPVKVQYVDAYGESMDYGDSEQYSKSVATQHDGFASTAGSEVEAASIVIWGGQDSAGKPLSTGWMVVVDY